MTQDEAKQVIAAIDAGRDVWVEFDPDHPDTPVVGWAVGERPPGGAGRAATHHTNAPQDVDDLRAFADRGERHEATARHWAGLKVVGL